MDPQRFLTPFLSTKQKKQKKYITPLNLIQITPKKIPFKTQSFYGHRTGKKKSYFLVLIGLVL